MEPITEGPWKIGRGGALWYVPIAPYGCEDPEKYLSEFGEVVPELATPVQREGGFLRPRPAPIKEALRSGKAFTLDLRSQRGVERSMANIELVIAKSGTPDTAGARRIADAIRQAGRKPDMAKAIKVLLHNPDPMKHDQEAYARMTRRFMAEFGPLLMLGSIHLRWRGQYNHLRGQGAWSDVRISDLFDGF